MNSGLLNGNVTKVLIKFSVPVFLSMLIQTLYSTVDMIIIGCYMGKDSISAVSVGGLIVYVAQVFVTGLINGVCILIARYVGQNNIAKIRKTIGYVIPFFIVVTASITLLMLLFCKQLAMIMNTPMESLEQTLAYVSICAMGLCFIVAFNLASAIFRGVGDSKSPFFFAIYACCINVVGDILLVVVLKMGIAGAALATIAAQGFSAIISFISLSRKKYMNDFSIKDITVKGSREVIYQIINLGFPLGLQDALIQFSFVLVQRLVNGMGIDYSASYGVGIKILGYILLVPTSFMVTLSTFVSQNIGAQKPERVKKGLLAGIRVSLIIGIIAYVLVFLQGDTLSRLFVSDENVVKLSAQFLKGIAIDGITLSFLYCLCGYFNGYGRSRFVMVQGILGAFLIRVPLAYFFSRYGSIFLIGLATPISSFLQMVFCMCYYKYLSEKKNICNYLA